MDTNHTPGSWHVARQAAQQDYPSGAAYVYEVWAHDGEQPVALTTDMEDAALIAAAPALLSALRELIRCEDEAAYHSAAHHAAIAAARKVLAAAGVMS